MEIVLDTSREREIARVNLLMLYDNDLMGTLWTPVDRESELVNAI